MELLRGNRLEVIIGKRGKTDFLDQDIHFTVDKRLAVFPEINLSQQSEQLYSRKQFQQTVGDCEN